MSGEGQLLFGRPANRMLEIAICGALFALRPPTYIEYASGQQGSDRIHIIDFNHAVVHPMF